MCSSCIPTYKVFEVVFLCVLAAVMESLNHTSATQSVCICVNAWACACMCRSGCMFASLCIFSDTTWRSLKLMGPPVASLLIFLHPSPLGCVLAAHPRSSRNLRTRQDALPLLVVLCFLVVFGWLTAQHTQIWFNFLGILSPCWPLHCWSSSLKPWPALWWAGLLPLCIRSYSFWSQRRGGNTGAVRSGLTVATRCFNLLLFALLLPNLITELLHAVQVRVVQKRQEVPVPQPVLWRGTGTNSCTGKPGKNVT